jgi:glycine cleavage system H protein
MLDGVAFLREYSGLAENKDCGRQATRADRVIACDSVKANSDLYSGVSGTVTEINAALADNPGLVNNDPYEAGWMIKVQTSDPKAFQSLLSSEEYLKKTGH